MIATKRVYEAPAGSDGQRILVDRLWPRGLSKRDAAVDDWMKDLAPSTELRRWFSHDPEKWPEFQRRYRKELKEHAEGLRDLTDRAAVGTVTLLYGARDEKHNEATVLAALVRTRLATRAREARAGGRATKIRRRRSEPPRV
jgi:uncharacterized protein YeaO (DUF488 family)